MDVLFVILTFSILINLLLFRWGIREHRSRRQWQQEAVVLQRALRHDKTDIPFRIWGLGLWILAGFLLVMVVLSSIG